MNGVLESGEEVVPLGVSEWGLRLILNGLAVNGGFDQAHGLTSHLE